MDVVSGKRASVAMALGACALWSAASAQIPVLPSAPLGKDRFALVIGNDRYLNVDQLPLLDNAVRDAEAFARKLESELGFVVNLKRNANRNEILAELEAFKRLLEQAPNAVGVFYFSGHGMQVENNNYLIGVEARLQTPGLMRDLTVPAHRVVSDMIEAKNRLNIVILDACRDNPFLAMRGGIALGSPRSTPPPFTTKPGLAPMYVPSTSGRAFLIAFAAGAGERAADSGPGDNGLFTGALLQALDEPGLSPTQLFERTQLAVARRSGNKQSPFVAIQGADDFKFRPGAPATQAAAGPAARPRSTPAEEEADWKRVAGGHSTALIEWFLGKHPEGRHRDEAAKRLASLKADADEAAYWAGVQSTKSPDQYEEFLQRYPFSKFKQLAEAILKTLRDNNPPPATTPTHKAIDPPIDQNKAVAVVRKRSPTPAAVTPQPARAIARPPVETEPAQTPAASPATGAKAIIATPEPAPPPTVAPPVYAPAPITPTAVSAAANADPYAPKIGQLAAVPPPTLPPIGNVPASGNESRWSGALERPSADPEERHLCRPGRAEFRVDRGRIVGVHVELDDKRVYELDFAGTTFYRASVEGELPASGTVDNLTVRLFNEIDTNFTSYRFQGAVEGDRFAGSWRMDGLRCRGTFAFTRAVP